MQGRKNNRSKHKKTKQNKKNHSKFKSVAFQNETIKKLWDLKKTTKDNMKTLGLTYDSNAAIPGIVKHEAVAATHDIDISKKKKKKKVPKEIVEMLDVQESTEPVRGKFFMTEEEQIYISRLINKYKDDYGAMFRDIKLNFKQHPKAYLERRCTRYLLLKESESS